jgi:hypothetical protein
MPGQPCVPCSVGSNQLRDAPSSDASSPISSTTAVSVSVASDAFSTAQITMWIKPRYRSARPVGARHIAASPNNFAQFRKSRRAREEAKENKATHTTSVSAESASILQTPRTKLETKLETKPETKAKDKSRASQPK